MNIQKPITVDKQYVANKYGYHFSSYSLTFKPKYGVGIYQVIGKFDELNNWKHLFRNEEALKQHINEYFLEKFKIKKDNLDSINKNIFFRILFPIYSIFKQDAKEAYKKLKQEVEDYKKGNVVPDDIDKIYLSGTCKIPEHMPEYNTTYYYLFIDKNNFKIEEVKLSESDVYEMQISMADYEAFESRNESNTYDYSFSHYFTSIDENKDSSYYLDSHNLINFDGKKWNLTKNSFIFLNYKDAIEEAKLILKKNIQNLENEIVVLKDILKKTEGV